MGYVGAARGLNYGQRVLSRCGRKLKTGKKEGRTAALAAIFYHSGDTTLVLSTRTTRSSNFKQMLELFRSTSSKGLPRVTTAT